MSAAARLPASARGALWMLAEAASMAIMIAAVRHLTREGMPSHEVAFFRGFFGLLLLGPWLFATLRTRPSLLWPPEWRLILLRNVLSVSGMIAMFVGIGGLAISDVVAIQFTHPLFVVIGAALILRETVGPARWSAVAAGFVGALIIIRPGFIDMNPLVFAVLFSALNNGGVQLITKHVSAGVPGSVLVFHMNLLLVPVALALAWDGWVWPPPHLLPWIVAVGLFGTLAHVFLARAFRAADASLVGPVDFMRLPIAALLGWVLFAETSDAATWLGAAIIAIVVVAITRREARRARDAV
ncbi:MAG: DMT family transporter [Alphaproteobacteria bacterium]